MAVLEAREIVKEFVLPTAKLRILDGVDLLVESGESVAIVGPSGAGKSTLLHILGTLDRPTGGTLRILEQDPLRMSEADLARFRNRHIGFVFQEHYLLPQCTALENVLVPTIVAGGGAEGRARELLERVGLGKRLYHLPAALSGGERQRVAIARALINRPELVLADEPTGNLDEQTAAEVTDLFLSLCRDEGVALVVVTHNADLAARLQKTYRLTGGKLTPL